MAQRREAKSTELVSYPTPERNKNILDFQKVRFEMTKNHKPSREQGDHQDNSCEPVSFSHQNTAWMVLSTRPRSLVNATVRHRF
jgi:hypothetical protein